ncbi:MAG: hypothetical protein CTY31_00030 [Hyphomicrobium sp.]|nr:MAG: hypothetical protein CTY39_01245 [Hyphomicrobium sp.]PPD01894.1 MAG: hypothetical protein CTY31_00030 [Hyphomicrobium sp.]
MSAIFKKTLLLAVLAAPLFSIAGEAEAKRRPPVCLGAIQGSASSTGILGQGTAIARSAARADWENRAENVYGRRYANLNKARLVRWDCKKGAILLAKCVVVARPCRA